MLKLFTLSLSLFLLAYCTPARQLNNTTASGATATSPAAGSDGRHFGAAVKPGPALNYDQLYSKMQSVQTMPAKVNAKVNAVCQSKGCWMNLVSDTDPAKPAMRVRFKDYAFFMPKDLAGQRVTIEGTATVEETSVEDLRHYAKDAGKSEAEINAITQPKRELTFEASGVVIEK
jgi:hypothetical protein